MDYFLEFCPVPKFSSPQWHLPHRLVEILSSSIQNPSMINRKVNRGFSHPFLQCSLRGLILQLFEEVFPDIVVVLLTFTLQMRPKFFVRGFGKPTRTLHLLYGEKSASSAHKYFAEQKASVSPFLDSHYAESGVMPSKLSIQHKSRL